MQMQVEFIGPGRDPKKRKRDSGLAHPDIQALTILSADWRQLLVECVKNGANARWDTWLKIGGIARKTLLQDLLNWLLKHGWVRVFEEKRSGDWWPYKLELLHYTALQTALGLVVKDEQEQILQTLLTQLTEAQDEMLQPALNDLYSMPVARAIIRAELLLKLHQWQTEGRNGTYRDFALFARNTTKALTSAEWQWLDAYCDLASYQIERHTPLLLLAANIQLSSMQGTLDLSVCKDIAALSPATCASVNAIHGAVDAWILVENRTSFERVARNRNVNEGVIWLPGYPPTWWKEAVSQLISLAPAPARVACDPDPAGIAIALSAIALFEAAHLQAKAWKMGEAELSRLTKKKPLSELDNQQLAGLLKQKLPPELKNLADYLLASQEKGEQEGFL